MKFKLILMGMKNGVKKSIINVPDVTIGIELLKKFNLTSKDVKNNLIFSLENTSYLCEIPGKIAEESNLFNETNIITIITYENFLNNYIDIEYDKETLKLEYVVNEKEFLKDWEIKNYPVFILEEFEKIDIKIIDNQVDLLELNIEDQKLLGTGCEEELLKLKLKEIEYQKMLLEFKINNSKKIFRNLVKQCHPDVGGDSDRFKDVMKIYEENK